MGRQIYHQAPSTSSLNPYNRSLDWLVGRSERGVIFSNGNIEVVHLYQFTVNK